MGWHYLKFALVLVVLGTVVGSVAGFWLGNNVVQVYHRFFRFPQLAFAPDAGAIGLALLVSAGAAMVGVIGAVRQAVRLPPAEAMRPEPPAAYRPALLERVGLAHLASTTFRMALRNLERRPWQAFFTAFGLALATGIPLVPGSLRDGIQHLLGFQWDVAQRQNVTVSLIEPGSSAALSEIRHLPGVQLAEPFRSAPARLRFGHHSRKIAITGLPPSGTLNRLLDTRSQPVPLPQEGLIISAKLAEILAAKPGDTLRMEVEEGERPTADVVLAGVFTDYAGVAAYMRLENLRRLLREGDTISGAWLSVDANRLDDFLNEVKQTPRIASMMMKEAVRQSFQKTTAETINMLQSMYFTFAVIVSFGVVYNSARIALSERARDLATLRVVGFTRGEVAAVLISELLMLLLVAVPAGLAFGSAMSAGIIQSASTETVRLPLILSGRSFATAVLIVTVSASVSFALVSRGIWKLDLLSVLKARD